MPKANKKTPTLAEYQQLAAQFEARAKTVRTREERGSLLERAALFRRLAAARLPDEIPEHRFRPRAPLAKAEDTKGPNNG